MSSPALLAAPQFKVEKGIPIPPRCASLFGGWRTLLDSMEIGDSFLVDDVKMRDRVLRVNCKDRRGMKVVSRKINGEGYRIWRVK